MQVLDEIVLDEARLPRLTRRLTRARALAACPCGTCGNCFDSARNWISQAARGARRSGFFSPQPGGPRLPVYRRPFRGGFVHLLTDNEPVPRVLDVHIEAPEPAQAQDANVDAPDSPPGDDATPSDDFEVSHRTPPGPFDDLPVAPGKPPLKQVVSAALGPWAKARWVRAASLDASGLLGAAGEGIYVIAWPGWRYLGYSHDMRHRILREHLPVMGRWMPQGLHRFRVYYMRGPNMAIEHAVLVAIKNYRAGGFAASRFTNLKTELEEGALP